MKKIMIVSLIAASFSIISAQNIKTGLHLAGNFGNGNIQVSPDYGVDFYILLKNNLFLKSSYTMMSSKRIYKNDLSTKKYDYSQKSFSGALIYVFNTEKCRPYIGLGIGYYKIDYDNNRISHWIKDTMYYLEYERINNKIGYHVISGIFIPVFKNISCEIMLKYTILQPSLERGFMSGYS